MVVAYAAQSKFEAQIWGGGRFATHDGLTEPVGRYPRGLPFRQTWALRILTWLIKVAAPSRGRDFPIS